MTIKIGVVDHLTAAVDGAKKVNNTRDLKKLRNEIDAMIKAEEAKTGVEAMRAAKIDRAAHDPAMAPIVTQAIGSLKRLGLSLEAAADLEKLNDALDAHRWGSNERLRIKGMLHQIGVLA
jgi:hypothetical protein